MLKTYMKRHISNFLSKWISRNQTSIFFYGILLFKAAWKTCKFSCYCKNKQTWLYRYMLQLNCWSNCCKPDLHGLQAKISWSAWSSHDRAFYDGNRAEFSLKKPGKNSRGNGYAVIYWWIVISIRSNNRRKLEVPMVVVIVWR